MSYDLNVFIPTNAFGVRRLNNIGKSGWMMPVIIIPITGFLWLIVFYAVDNKKEGIVGENILKRFY